jgi:N-acetylglucosaminyl-diphospho-decaprenol L-rhamnosyltransferase
VEAVRELAPSARVIEAGANLGYGAGNNRGAAEASGEVLVFLNPDAMPAPGFREAILAPQTEGRGWSAWQGLVTAEDGRIVNTRGGVVHFTGIAWAGGAGEALPAVSSEGASATGDPGEAGIRPGTAGLAAGQPLPEPGFVSGACLAIPRERFEAVGGFAEDFFLYHEDVDLSLRLRLAGGRLGVEPGARVDHDYEFEKGPLKWRGLERNRWATLIRTYPGPLLAVLAPALVATEIALLGVALAGGWLPQKLASWGDVLRALPALRRERAEIRAARRIGAAAFAEGLTADLGSAYLGAAGRSRALRSALRAYWRVALVLLGGR